jgi:hypothetical protein
MSQENRKKASVRLLKSANIKNGKKYYNLYLQLDEGSPIQIQLVFFNPNIKNLLLANAYDCEIQRNTNIVVADDNGVVPDGKKD